jgi:transcriptional antiterminator RfaH
MPGRWAVAITQPQQEAKVVIHAERSGFECYLPLYRTVHKRLTPLFPRYVFVDARGFWRQLLSTIGINGVIMDGNKPATLSDEIIDAIRLRCDRNGVFIPPPKPRKFGYGQRVRVDCGPMLGLTGIVRRMRGRDRVEILISMLGRRAAVHIYEGDLRAA